MVYCVYRQYGDEETFLCETRNYHEAASSAKTASKAERGIPVEVTYEDGEHKEFWLNGTRVDDLTIRNTRLYHAEQM